MGLCGHDSPSEDLSLIQIAMSDLGSQSPSPLSSGELPWKNTYDPEVWNDEQDRNAVRNLQLPPTRCRTTETPSTRQDQPEKSYTDTFQVYAESLRVHLKEARPWTEFGAIAMEAREKWQQYIGDNEIPSNVAVPFRAALEELHYHDESEADAVFSERIWSSTLAFRDAVRCITGNRVEQSRLRKKINTVGETHVLYDREVSIDVFKSTYGEVILSMLCREPSDSFSLTSIVGHPPTAEKVASCVASTFLSGMGRDAFKTVLCRLLVEMLHTDSWYSMLTTHNETMFVKGEATDSGFVLYTSDVYTCDGRFLDGVTSFHGILGVLLRLSSVRSTRAFDKRSLFLRITDKAAMLEGSTGAASSPPADEARSNGEDRPVKRARRSCDVTNPIVFRDDWLKEGWSLDQRELIRFVLREGRELYDGNWATVRVADFLGTRAVVKYWNGRDMEGLRRLKNETSVLRRIWTHHRELIGSVIPPLMGLRQEPEEHVTIVTEYVGDQVRVEGDAKVIVGEQRVSGDGLQELIAAGERTVRRLHRAGISHENLEHDSIRAAKSKVSGWQVWLVGFGSASMDATARGMEGEIRHIRDYLGAETVELPTIDGMQTG